MDNFDKQLETILIYRKPEFWLNDMFSNLTEYIHDDFPYLIFYKNKNDLLFKYDLKIECFYYHYEKIYLILRNKYHCNELKCDELIKCMVEKHLTICVKTTQTTFADYLNKLEENLKLSEITI